jgi:geranylgeranyl diphosphate synthase type I
MAAGRKADRPGAPLRKKKTMGPLVITRKSARSGTAEHPRFNNFIEWWFFHGSFTGPVSGCRYVMASIFRYRMPRYLESPTDGYYLVLSVLDPLTGKNSVVSRGEKDVVDTIFKEEKEKKRINLDPRLIETYIDELRSSGPSPPVSLEHEKAKITSSPFSLVWKDFSLVQTGSTFRIEFRDPGSGILCDLALEPVSSRYLIEGIGASSDHPMAYATYPRLGLTGMFGDEEVKGTAWFDHQWGNARWFLSQPSGGNVIGWEWVGINGDDGSDWIILTFRDMESRKILNKIAILFKDHESPKVFRKFTARAVRFWESEKTHIRYPVGWSFEIPEISVKITVDAITNDQEIPVLGLMRAVWEGAASVSGTSGVNPFSGTSRLELHGYGYIIDFNQYLQFHVNRIDGCIRAFFPQTMTPARYRQFAGSPRWRFEVTACNDTITRPVWDLMSRKKKYWRPVFSALMLEALCVSSEKYKMLLSVVPELTHTGTLIIDDIEDNATIRRGDASIHKKYGLDIAINAANTLYFLPSVLYSQHPDLTDQQRLDFYHITLDTFIKGHFGQAQDIFWTKNLSEKNISAWSGDHLPEKILQMYEFKTASPAIAAAESVCILAGTNSQTKKACVAFARALGVSFQITNDIHCFTGAHEAGENRCDDLASGKLTYVIILALNLLGTRDSNRLRRILCSRRLRNDPEVLVEGIDLVRKSGALEDCYRMASSMFEEGWVAFSRVLPPSEPKMMLRLFSKNLVAPSERLEYK